MKGELISNIIGKKPIPKTMKHSLTIVLVYQSSKTILPNQKLTKPKKVSFKKKRLNLQRHYVQSQLKTLHKKNVSFKEEILLK